MNLEDFLGRSVIPQLQVTSLYFKPEIPRDKLANAIREYAPGVGMSAVVVLLDETYFGNAKEGMIVTNEKIILSKKLGGHVIQFSEIDRIEIGEKNLIVNDLPLAKFSKPEVMPLAAFGAKLNEFVVASKRASDGLRSKVALDDAIKNKLISFLGRIVEPLYFDSIPVERRMPGAVTIGYVTAANITDDQCQVLRFKAGLASSEEILCVSWLDGHGDNDYFFCVTDCGVYSVRPSEPMMFISHEDLSNLHAIEEYKESRYVGLRLSNNQGFIVSIQNVSMRPFAYELFTGLISILNGREPESRSNDGEGAGEGQLLQSQSLRSESAGKAAHALGGAERVKSSPQDKNPIPFQNHNQDQVFDVVVKLNSINNVGGFISSVLSNSENSNSQIRKSFQSYIARSVKSFRKEVVENGGFSQFRNDLATMEICGAALTVAIFQMSERGVNMNLADRILSEGVRATFGIDGGVRGDPVGVALMKIIESYDLGDDDDGDVIVFNIVMRLIGSNLAGGLRPDYLEILRKYAISLQDFIPKLDRSFARFMQKMESESNILIDEILNTRW